MTCQARSAPPRQTAALTTIDTMATSESLRRSSRARWAHPVTTAAWLTAHATVSPIGIAHQWEWKANPATTTGRNTAGRA